MKFKMIHENYNVRDLSKSLEFYKKALGLEEKRRKEAEDGSFIIVYIGNEESEFELELTWLADHPDKYDIGEEEFHLAFRTDDYEAAHKLHEEMGCICYENPNMGIYFIQLERRALFRDNHSRYQACRKESGQKTSARAWTR